MTALALVLAVVLLAPTSGNATVATDICPPSADPCIVPKGETIVATPGSILDFGSRALVLPSGSGTRLEIAGGSLTIFAGSLTLNAGSLILGTDATITISTIGDIIVARDGNSRARIDVADEFAPGTIALQTAAGNVIVDGIIDLRGTSADAGIGILDLDVGGDIVIDGEIRATGIGFAGGGDVSISAAGEVTIPGIIDASGGDGGVIDIVAQTRITTDGKSVVSRLDARATSGGGSGGEISISSPGPVTLGSTLHLQGENSRDFGGDGGFLTIDAGGTLTLSGEVKLFGTFPDGSGGEADLTSELDVVHTSLLDATGSANFGFGGFVSVGARRNVLLGQIDVSADCPTCDGGEIDVEAWCALSIPPTGALVAVGTAGTVILESGESVSALGSVTAGGVVEVLYHPLVGAPDLVGAPITPAPTLIEDVGVIPCGGASALTCGNGEIESLEECDDGNDASCDGCSFACQEEGPGNGRLDCGEACDDGNTVDCDGCSGDLSRVDSLCGDSITECGETCDDGNATPCDGCSTLCQIERCGNGVPECGEECDLGDALNGGPTSDCDANCERVIPPSCGNGIVDSDAEQCDDGGVDCDAGMCSSRCEPEACGNGRQECAEECDDFNRTPCDGCSPECGFEVCGNGIVDCGEECDDGAANGQPGSICLADTCTVGTLCSADVSGPCIPCIANADCNPGGICAGVECIDGTCTPTTVGCDDGNPCTSDACDPTDGCASTLLPAIQVPECSPEDACEIATCSMAGCTISELGGFDQIYCRLDGLRALLGDPAVDERAQRKLGKLLEKVDTKTTTAAAATAAGPTKKVKKNLKKATRLLAKLRKKVLRFTGVRIPLAVATDLVDALDETSDRMTSLRTDLGVL